MNFKIYCQQKPQLKSDTLWLGNFGWECVAQINYWAQHNLKTPQAD